jgi:hypothetical protein
MIVFHTRPRPVPPVRISESFVRPPTLDQIKARLRAPRWQAAVTRLGVPNHAPSPDPRPIPDRKGN